MDDRDRLSSQLGELIRKYRTKAGLSQQKLSEICQLDKTYISLLERGRRMPTVYTIVSIIKALGIDMVDFLWKLQSAVDERSALRIGSLFCDGKDEAVVIIDESYTVVRANAKAAELFGIHDRTSPKKCFDFFCKSDTLCDTPSMMSCPVSRMNTGDLTRYNVIQVHHNDGQKRLMLMRAFKEGALIVESFIDASEAIQEMLSPDLWHSFPAMESGDYGVISNSEFFGHINLVSTVIVISVMPCRGYTRSQAVNLALVTLEHMMKHLFFELDIPIVLSHFHDETLCIAPAHADRLIPLKTVRTIKEKITDYTGQMYGCLDYAVGVAELSNRLILTQPVCQEMIELVTLRARNRSIGFFHMTSDQTSDHLSRLIEEEKTRAKLYFEMFEERRMGMAVVPVMDKGRSSVLAIECRLYLKQGDALPVHDEGSFLRGDDHTPQIDRWGLMTAAKHLKRFRAISERLIFPIAVASLHDQEFRDAVMRVQEAFHREEVELVLQVESRQALINAAVLNNFAKKFSVSFLLDRFRSDSLHLEKIADLNDHRTICGVKVDWPYWQNEGDCLRGMMLMCVENFGLCTIAGGIATPHLDQSAQAEGLHILQGAYLASPEVVV